ncbi:hypothetical protein HCH_04973 [Hahella chejuensis KCTC 2396]|uniref:Uncharacterized protein n=1 Tax=Hahella chejuensis (strain KCTC 2396) TaxID=349521 RepID=Q2SCG1_HAHCH|nr:hypothetical protein HCH_04973 [Hahella chejuensis KCTC 2396]
MINSHLLYQLSYQGMKPLVARIIMTFNLKVNTSEVVFL